MNQERTDSMKTCERCGAAIVLLPQGLHFKWVLASQPKKMLWKCDPTPEFPVRSHAPTGSQA